MDKDKREGWLKELKVGQEVAIECGSFGYRDYVIKKIDKISPTGRITTGITVYDSSGREMGKSDAWSRASTLTPVTQDIRHFVRRKYLHSKIKNFKWENVSTTDLEEIAKILRFD